MRLPRGREVGCWVAGNHDGTEVLYKQLAHTGLTDG